MFGSSRLAIHMNANESKLDGCQWVSQFPTNTIKLKYLHLRVKDGVGAYKNAQIFLTQPKIPRVQTFLIFLKNFLQVNFYILGYQCPKIEIIWPPKGLKHPLNPAKMGLKRHKFGVKIESKVLILPQIILLFKIGGIGVTILLFTANMCQK